MWAGSGWRTALLTYFTLISPLHSIRRVTIAAGKAFFLFFFFSISPPQTTTKLSVRGLCSRERGREKCYLEIRGCASCRIRSRTTITPCFDASSSSFSNFETAPNRCRRNRRIPIEERKKERSLNSSPPVSFFLFSFFYDSDRIPGRKDFSIRYLENLVPISLYFPRIVKLVFHRNRSFRGVLPPRV